MKIACGHFKGETGAKIKTLGVLDPDGILNPQDNFIIHATGDSMEKGDLPIYEGDMLLMEKVSQVPHNLENLKEKPFIVEYIDKMANSQYALKWIAREQSGTYNLVSTNSKYRNIPVDIHNMRPFARLIRKIPRHEHYIHKSIMREEIPKIFGLTFNNSWRAGHICPSNTKDQFLFVNLIKTDVKDEHRYRDYFQDVRTFHWQSQNSTTPTSKRGKG